MKLAAMLGSMLCVILLSASSNAATLYFGASLNGASEVPPVSTSAIGQACLTLDTATMQLTGTVVYAGTGTPQGVYGISIMEGAAGSASASGTNLVTLPRGPSPVAVSQTLDATQTMKMSDLVTYPLYVNLFSAAGPSPGGEIRGTLVSKVAADVCPTALDAGAPASDAGTDAGTVDSGGGGATDDAGSSGGGGGSDSGSGGGSGGTSDGGNGASGGSGSSGGCASASEDAGAASSSVFGVALVAMALVRSRRPRRSARRPSRVSA